MITLMLLILTIAIFAAMTIMIGVVGGAGILIVFGDAIVAVAVIVWVIKKCCSKKNHKEPKD